VSYPAPLHAVWELTLRCNLRCRYCGSAAGRARDDELSTDESLRLCEAIRRLGVGRVTLMGGEPFLREDWAAIVAKLQQLGQPVDIISNGQLCDRATVRTLRQHDVYGLSLSLDGPEPVHDDLRARPGAFGRVARAVEHAQEAGLRVGIVTHVNRANLPFLDPMYELLASWAVDGWQLQLTSPLGYAAGTDCLVPESAILELHGWALAKQRVARLHLYFADDIGYFHPDEPILRSGQAEPSVWAGCPAGLHSFGIASNGGIRGCLSLPETFTEGNVRERPLREIWADPALFAYNRRPEPLQGGCTGCVYGKICRGGCRSFTYAASGRFGDMTHCWYRLTR